MSVNITPPNPATAQLAQKQGLMFPDGIKLTMPNKATLLWSQEQAQMGSLASFIDRIKRIWNSFMGTPPIVVVADRPTGAPISMAKQKGSDMAHSLEDFVEGVVENAKFSQNTKDKLGQYALDAIDSAKPSREAIEKLNTLITSWLKGTQLSQENAAEFRKLINSFGFPLQDGITDVFKKGMLNMRNFGLIHMLPHTLFGLAMSGITTLALQYIYQRACYSIGRPKLAVREKYVTGIAHTLTSFVHYLQGTKPAIAPSPIFSEKLSQRLSDFSAAIKLTVEQGGFFQNIMFYGPGGVGKTMMAEKIAQDAGVNFVMMSGGDLAQYIRRGEHVTELNRLFDAAENSSKPTVVFIDEAEGLCLDRKYLNTEQIQLLNAFLNRTGTQSKKIILVLATNCPDNFDEAVLSRMDHKIAVELPGLPERIKIIQMYVNQLFDTETAAARFSQQEIERLAQKTDGLTGRALFKMLNVMLGNKRTHGELTPEMVERTVSDFVEQEVGQKEEPVAVATKPEPVRPQTSRLSNLFSKRLRAKDVAVATAAPAA